MNRIIKFKKIKRKINKASNLYFKIIPRPEVTKKRLTKKTPVSLPLQWDVWKKWNYGVQICKQTKQSYESLHKIFCKLYRQIYRNFANLNKLTNKKWKPSFSIKSIGEFINHIHFKFLQLISLTFPIYRFHLEINKR